MSWEKRCAQANERKKSKYEGLIQGCGRAGRKAWNYPDEVGRRGYPVQLLGMMFHDVATVGQARKLATREASQLQKVAPAGCC